MLRILLVSLLFAGCSLTPPRRAVALAGEVRAYDRQTAEAMAALLDQLAPRVRELVGSTRADPIKLWIKRTRLVAGAYGTVTTRGFVLLGQEAMEDSPAYHLAHELTHWYLPHSSFAGVPYFVEEGTADWIGLEVVAGVQGHVARGREIAATEFSTIDREALFSVKSWAECSLEQSQPLTMVASAVVHRLGLDGVRALAQRGAAPEEYLAAAGIAIPLKPGAP